jgi:hypothetical protein
MLESVSDLVSLIVMIFCVVLGIYYLYSLSNLHRSIELKKKEDLYYRLHEELNEDEEKDDTGIDSPDD